MAETRRDTTSHLPPIRYFTPAPEIILGIDDHSRRSRVINRWHVGLHGLRNLVRVARTPTSHHPLVADHHSFVLGLSNLFIDCVALVYNCEGHPQLYLLTELPSTAVSSHAPPIVLSTPVEGRADVVTHLQAVMSETSSVRLREVRCSPIAMNRSAGADTELTVRSLGPLGEDGIGAATLKPVALVVARCHSPNGLELVLKVRTRLTDIDDFDKLSLLSARVQEGDLAAALNSTVSSSVDDDMTALEDLWIAAGSPTPFVLPTKTFALAAQRELFVSCGLDIDEERLQFRGYQIVQHEDRDEQLGFAIFTVDFRRGPDVDEVRHALTRNPHGLVRVPIEAVYDGRPINRFLRVGRTWLEQNCLAPELA